MQSLSSFTQNIPTLKHITLYTLALIRIPHPVWESAKATDVTSGFPLSYFWHVFIKVGNLQHKAQYCGSLYFNNPSFTYHKRIQSNSIQRIIRKHERVENLILCSRRARNRNLIQTFPRRFLFTEILFY